MISPLSPAYYKFKSFHSWLNESFPKNKWDTPDKEEFANDLVTLVQTAYKSAPKDKIYK